MHRTRCVTLHLNSFPCRRIVLRYRDANACLWSAVVEPAALRACILRLTGPMIGGGKGVAVIIGVNRASSSVRLGSGMVGASMRSCNACMQLNHLLSCATCGAACGALINCVAMCCYACTRHAIGTRSTLLIKKSHFSRSKFKFIWKVEILAGANILYSGFVKLIIVTSISRLVHLSVFFHTSSLPLIFAAMYQKPTPLRTLATQK